MHLRSFSIRISINLILALKYNRVFGIGKVRIYENWILDDKQQVKTEISKGPTYRFKNTMRLVSVQSCLKMLVKKHYEDPPF